MAARAQPAMPAAEEETPRTAPLMPETAQGELAAVQAARDAVLTRIAAGDHVEPGDLLDAETNLRMAEVRIELADRNAAAAAETVRLNRLSELVDSLTGAGQQQRLKQVIVAYNAALTAVQALHDAAKSRQDVMRADLSEARRLGFVADRVLYVGDAQQLPLPPGCTIEGDGYGVSVTANGVTASLGNDDDPATLVVEVVATVVKTDPASTARSALIDVNNSPGVYLQRLERMLAATDEDE